jgi:EAL domain-containing protein (putative c-di-GMP-specific phosphodiesterase class I)
VLHYQPKMTLDAGHCVGFEALLRLKRLDGSVTGPAAFSAAFDEPTLSPCMGSHVLRCAVAQDDFGTGFASLVHLRKFAYDQIKIDGSFVRAITASSVDHAIVKAIIDMAKALGKHVDAEGVETVAELYALQALGCHYRQGYLFGPLVSLIYVSFATDGRKQGPSPHAFDVGCVVHFSAASCPAASRSKS